MSYEIQRIEGEGSNRAVSLEIAETMIQARAAIDGYCGDYDTTQDPEGYVDSILIAMLHHCHAAGGGFGARLDRARRAYQADLFEDVAL
jgi:hypothetical protein